MAGRAAAHRRWTQTDITALRKLVSADGSPDEISGALDREPADVARMMGRLRLRRTMMIKAPVA